MNVEKWIFIGCTTWKNCGASGGQESALAADQAFSNIVKSNYSTDFGENQSMMNNLSSNLQQTINAGAGQQGFSPTELASMNSQAINQAAAQNTKVQQQIGESAAAHGGGAPGVESGVTQAEQSAAASSADSQMNNQLANITQKNYQTGQQNYWNAVGEQEKLPSAFESPSTKMAGEVIGANNATSGQADENAAANNAWMGMVGGLAGDAASAYACVTPATMILLADGREREAQDIQPGDQLRGLNGPEIVLAIQVSYQPIARLSLFMGETIDVSRSHTFATPSGGYVIADQAKGKMIRTLNGSSRVIDVEPMEDGTVLKLILSGEHAYVSNGIWSLE